MTQAKAQSVASALIGAGYLVTVTVADGGEWIVAGFPTGGTEIPASAAASFAASQVVVCIVPSATFR